jgi:phosphate transport system substrate-binding protein
MRHRLIRMIAVVGLVGLVAGVFKAPPAYAADKQKVVGAGSSFSYLLLDQWRADTANRPFSLDFNYQASGSTQGRLNFGQKQIDFASSDIPYQPDDSVVPAAGSYRYVTAVAGALSFMFNLVDDSGNRVENLRLDSKQACRIFTEPLVKNNPMKWNDREIAALNPGLVLPDKEIAPVVRQDGSGTSFVLSEYCIATQPEVWKALRDAALTNSGLASRALLEGRPVSTWPNSRFQAAPLSTGIANTVSSTPGGITYIEAGYKDITGLPLASVDNAAGVPVAPSPSAITAALSYASVRPDGTFQLDFKTADPAAYLPSTYSYLIVPTTIDPGKGRTLAEYIYYGMTFGQDSAEPLAFAKLSQNLIDDAIKTAAQLPGATPFADWKTAVGLTAAAGGGSTGGGSTGGGATGGGATGGGATGGGATGGGATGDGATGGGTTSGGTTSGGTTGGETPSGGTSDGGAGPATGAVDSAGNTVATVLGASTNSGASDPSGTGAGANPNVVASKAAAPGAGKAGATAAKRTTAGGQVAPASAPVVSRKAPGPSNADYVWVAFQGAALVGVGWAVVKMRGSMA